MLTSFMLNFIREQLREMAAKFHFPSVERFATEVLKSTSNQRLSWLHRYYSSHDHPDLASTVSKHFPQPISSKSAPSPPSSGGPCEDATKTIANFSPNRKRNKRSKLQEEKLQVQEKKSRRDRLEDIPSPEADWPEEKVEITSGFRKCKRREKITLFNDRNVETEDDFDIPGFTSTVANDKNPETSPEVSIAPFQQAPKEQTSSKNTQETTRNSGFNPNSFLADLIGDTSILSDLFKPKRTSSKVSSPRTCPNKPSLSKTSADSPSSSKTTIAAMCAVSPPNTAVKKASKDFWDVLQEEDEESWNRLTDPPEVQRVCVNTTIAARHHYKQEENKGLWKTNDKFLWKK